MLVVGAGALGNEVIKNLALLGVGHVAIADMDSVEVSNLSRSVLFSSADEGRPKAEAAARAARNSSPDIDARPLVGNALGDVGLGWFRWADAVVGALDNREARLFVNSSCAASAGRGSTAASRSYGGRPRIRPAAVGVLRVHHEPGDWELVNRRRSCSLSARRAVAQRGTPTTPTTASVIGAHPGRRKWSSGSTVAEPRARVSCSRARNIPPTA